MLRRLFASLFIVAALSAAPTFAVQHTHKATAESSNALAEYDSESAAQRHCPRDTVVWLNTNSGIYHEKGMRWYGRTRVGAYVCKTEADAAGDRDTRNGQ